MNNGLQKISFFSLLVLFFFNVSYSNSIEIEVAPLINLDEIVPSYDESDENLDDLELEIEIDTNKKIKTSIKNLATLGLLNKVTAEVSSIKILSGEEIDLYGLKVINKSCHISLPEDKPLVGVYLIVDDLKGDNDFSGWMIKDLPSISSMEHPLYDIWVEDCI
tara:strand:- start:267 stop:755 length:489 start_codon:yes stop_codon:yes gene_type:complete